MSALKFQMPKEVSMRNEGDNYGRVTLAPLEKGYGTTIGNALRRVLLSSLEGHAITAIRIPGIPHEFSSVEGVTEDVVELILNLKQVRFKKKSGHTEEKIFILIKKQEIFKAGDIVKFSPSFEIKNPDHIICHLDPSTNFELEITVEKGRGYVPANENKPANPVIGLIPTDAIFTPIKDVQYKVEDIRVEQKMDYEKLTLDVKTDGTITPEQAIKAAVNLLIKHFSLFPDITIVTKTSKNEEMAPVDEKLLHTQKLLKKPLSSFDLSARAFNCLNTAGICTLEDLVKLKVVDMEKFRNFGKKSHQELQELMEKNKLSFGMDLSKYKMNEKKT